MKQDFNNPDHDEPYVFDRLSSDQQQVLLDWITEYISPRKTFNTRHSSYGLKHTFQSQGGFYIYNGAFKGAMLKSGYDVRDKSDLNWHFNISQKSKAFQSNR